MSLYRKCQLSFSWRLTIAAAQISLLLFTGTKVAQGIEHEGPIRGGGTEISEVNTLAWEGVSGRLGVYNNNLMGDEVDLATGTLSFNQTDIEIKGNFDLDVAIKRKTKGRNLQPESAAFMADWQLDVPYMSMLMQKHVGGIGNDLYDWPNRCSGPTYPERLLNWTPAELWDGLYVNIPGEGSQRVLDNPDSQIFGEHAPTKSTKGHLLISCIDNIGQANGGGEGFIVKTPDGTQYRFDILGYLDARDARRGSWSKMARRVGMLYASEVKDRHGNWVKYHYNPQKKLTSITSSDNRHIALTYNQQGFVSSATANNRTWLYQYNSLSDQRADNIFTLAKVIQPDQSEWSFNFSRWRNVTLKGHCTRGDINISMEHPHGAKANFVLAETRFGKSGVPYSFVENHVKQGLTGCYEDYVYKVMPWFENMAVVSKELSGPSIDTAIWTYEYPKYDNGNFSTTEGPQDLRMVKVVDPLGQYTEHYFNRRWGKKNGQLAKTIDYSNDGEILKTTVNSYITVEDIFGYPYYNVLDLTVDTRNSSTATYKTASVITQDGDTYTTRSEYEVNPSSALYSYGNPTSESIQTNIHQTPRKTEYTYHHIKSNWILGLVKKREINDRLMEEYSYNSSGQKKLEKRFGKKFASFDYHTAQNYSGALQSIEDAEGRITYAKDWKRGIARRVIRPDGTEIKLSVDNNGWVTSSTNALNVTVNYLYDVMGRNTTIDLPSDWADTKTEFKFGHHHVQEITKGDLITKITYDNLFRPILEEKKDRTTNKSVYRRYEYDKLGREKFLSIPSFSSEEMSGVTTKYDVLGRVTSKQETHSPYAQTTFKYLNSHRKRVIDPLGHFMDYYGYGYDGPNSDNFRSILAYDKESRFKNRTVVGRNVWGQIIQTQQHGTSNGYDVNRSRVYIYNASQQLCRIRNKDVGDTIYQYDSSGVLIAYQQGLPSDSNACGAWKSSESVSLLRDEQGRVTKIDYPGSDSQDITYKYDAQGNTRSIARGNTFWSYKYNDIELTTEEILEVDNRNYKIGYEYSPEGNLIHKRFPSGKVLRLNPNGMGQPTEMQWGPATKPPQTIARNISYHANGLPADYTYGNGVVNKSILNTAGKIKQLSAKIGSKAIVDLQFKFDGKQQLTSIVDGIHSENSRINEYDPLGRLTYSSGAWGNGSFIYDSLGNLRSKKIGSRSVDVFYDENNRVIQSVDDIDYTGTREFDYDSRGNVKTAGGLQFSYGFDNRANEVSGQTSANYSYDGNLKRVKAVVDGKTLYNVYDKSGALILVDNVSDNKLTEYIKLGSNSIARVAGSQPTFLHNDLWGSAIAATNYIGEVDWSEVYTPFGMTLNNHQSNDDQSGFTGHIKDSSTGLIYMQARYYDPVISRFYSNDPVDMLGHVNRGNSIHGFNRYVYANNNPYKYVDPDGNYSTVGALAASGMFVLGFAADAGAQAIFNKGKVDYRQSVVAGFASIATGSSSVVLQAESFLARSTMGVLINATVAAGASAVNDAHKGNTPTVNSTAKAVAYQTAGPGKVIGTVLGTLVGGITKSKFAEDAVTSTITSIVNTGTDIAGKKATAKPGALDEDGEEENTGVVVQGGFGVAGHLKSATELGETRDWELSVE